MTNIFKTPEKVETRDRLFRIGLDVLRDQGWQVEKKPGLGKSSVRQITKGGKTRLVSIRTSQNTWIAFARNLRDTEWGTLADVDLVLAVSVDDPENPRFGQVHMIEASEMRERFDRAYAARRKAGRKVQLGRGMWISLYQPEASKPVLHVGAGAGLEHPHIARIPLEPSESDAHDEHDSKQVSRTNESLTIAEAKRRLAISLGVDPSSIRITVEA
ncbi:MAG TPA: hypothetical protein VGD60_10115 [Candidatus Acidoferrales bacterium]